MSGIIFSTAAVLIATFIGWTLWRSPNLLFSRLTLHTDSFINKQIKYQASFFFIAVVIFCLAKVMSPDSISEVFALGRINAPLSVDIALPVQLSQIAWSVAGSAITLGLALSTLLVVLPAFRTKFSSSFFKKYGVWAISFAAMNALSEELIYRGAIIAPAMGHLPNSQIAILSALLFAFAHVRGQANGIVVIVGSAVVGWLLTYSVLQTHGLFWAWVMHFTQDVIIFLAFFVTSSKSAVDT